MTKFGVISDVHADLHALRDALARLDRIGTAAFEVRRAATGALVALP